MTRLGTVVAGDQYQLPTITLAEAEGYSLVGAGVVVSLWFGPITAPRFEISKSLADDPEDVTLDTDTGALTVMIQAADWAELPAQLRDREFDLQLQVEITLDSETHPGPWTPIYAGLRTLRVKPQR